MIRPRSASRRGRWYAAALGLIAVLSTMLASPLAALAHPLDICLQASYITVGPAEIVVEMVLTPGVLVAPQLLQQIDLDGDEVISEPESRAYVESVLQNVTLQLDGQAIDLAITKIDTPDYLLLQAGYGAIRIFTSAILTTTLSGTHEIAFRNDYAPAGSAYQVNAFVAGDGITLGTQNRDEIQQSMTVAVGFSGAMPAETSETSEFAATLPGNAHRLLAAFDAPSLSPAALLLALAVAVVLGGVHALTPGHGKTLVAAYLVGSRGTVRHAIWLGTIVTFTHTASVIVIGLLALSASQFIVPSVLVPILEIVSGALVVALGARLVWQRWFAYRRRDAADAHPLDHHHPHHDDHHHDHEHAHDHHHAHEHGHFHSHGAGHAHSHGGKVHTHLPPAEGFNLGSLLAMGVSGGLVPCPEALGIMIIAVGLNRMVLGLSLIVSFSFGLAAMLIAIGVLLVRSRSLVERFGGTSGKWTSALPLGSAVIVTVLGVGITLGGVSGYLH